MRHEQRTTVKASHRLEAALFAVSGAASLYCFVLMLPYLDWTVEETNPSVSFVTLMLLAMGLGSVRLLLGGPYHQRLGFDAQRGSVEVEYSYLGRTVSRMLHRTELASVDWAVVGNGAEGETAGLRVTLCDGPVLFLEAPRDSAAVFAEALGLQLNEIVWKALPRTPPVWNAERALYPAPAAS